MSVLVQLFLNAPGSMSRANAFAETHRPLPEQSLGHMNLSHAEPSNMFSHLHWPVERLQLPRLEHSTSWWAESLADAESLIAFPRGHVRREQSAPVNPSKQVHTPHGVVHLPFAEHEFGQGVASICVGFEMPAAKTVKILENKKGAETNKWRWMKYGTGILIKTNYKTFGVVLP